MQVWEYLFVLQAETEANTECPCEVAVAGLDVGSDMMLTVNTGEIDLGLKVNFNSIKDLQALTSLNKCSI